MKIGFDAKRIFNNFSGLGNYSREVLRLNLDNSKISNIKLFNSKFNKDFNLVSHNKLEIINPKFNFLNFFWRSFYLPFLIKKNDLDIYHGLTNEIPFFIKNSKTKYIVTIHDLIFLKCHKDYNFLDRLIYKFKTKISCKNADLIIAISKKTKADLVSYYNIKPSKIKIIYQTCDPIFKKKFEFHYIKNIVRKYDLPVKFLLYVGKISERKNLITVIKSIIKLKNEKLVIIGQSDKKYLKKCIKLIEDKKLTNRIKFLNIKSKKELAVIYQLSKVLIYVSYFEGFGLPIIEGINSKIPIIASNTDEIKEAGGKSIFYVNPGSVDEIRDKIKYINNNPILIQNQINCSTNFIKKFSEEIIQNQIYNTYKSLL